jgi:hypothetical protein
MLDPRDCGMVNPCGLSPTVGLSTEDTKAPVMIWRRIVNAHGSKTGHDRAPPPGYGQASYRLVPSSAQAFARYLYEPCVHHESGAQTSSRSNCEINRERE